MGRMSSISNEEKNRREYLLNVARTAITQAAHKNEMPSVELEGIAPELLEPRASFVTIHVDGELKGCIGSLEPSGPLVKNVAKNAYRAALFDSRFQPVSEEDLARMSLHISVLSPLERIPCENMDELLPQVRPGIDGLVVTDAEHRGTYLPSVWEHFDEVSAFLHSLWLKAGLTPGDWPDNLEVYRYTVE